MWVGDLGAGGWGLGGAPLVLLRAQLKRCSRLSQRKMAQAKALTSLFASSSLDWFEGFGLGFGDVGDGGWGLGCRVWGSGSGVQGVGLMV